MRTSGVLMPISSLPSPYGIGTMGKAARKFVDFLKKGGQKYWQILPLGPTSYGDSPYQSPASIAGNPYFIDLPTLVEEGLLEQAELDAIDWGDDPTHVAYDKIYNGRFPLLKKAMEKGWEKELDAINAFRAENHEWLEDYALFMALRDFFQKPWTQWPEDIRKRWDYSLDYYHRTMYYDVEFQKFLQ